MHTHGSQALVLLRLSQAVADRSAGALRREQLGNISAKAQKDIADVSAFTFQVATSACPTCCSVAGSAPVGENLQIGRFV